MRRTAIIRAKNDVHKYQNATGEMRCDEFVECCVHEQTTLKLRVQAINLPLAVVLSGHHNCVNFGLTAITQTRYGRYRDHPKPRTHKSKWQTRERNVTELVNFDASSEIDYGIRMTTIYQ
jgi:hypothetical protein